MLNESLTEEDFSSDTASVEEPLLEDEKSWSLREQHARHSKKRRLWTTVAIVCVGIALLVTSVGFAIWTVRNRGHLHKEAGSGKTHPICPKPRVRKEWRSLSSTEKQAYIKAVQCLSTIPSKTIPNGTLHDDFAYAHNGEGEHSHKAAPFLPWHRYYLHFYERTLQNRCHYDGTVPYWDWTQDWEDPLKSSIWDPDTGFGGNGNTSTPQTVGFGHCVQDGPFQSLQLQNYGDESKPHCLSRGFIPPKVRPHFGAKYLNPTAMANVFDTDDFYKFTSKLEEGAHLSIPRLIQGDWRKHTAPNDPVFFLHHAQLDRLWWNWQLRDIGRRAHAYNGPVQENSTIEATLADQIDLTMMLTPKIPVPKVSVEKLMLIDQGFLCYEYGPPS